MLLNTLLTKYGWLITSVPQILHSHPLWKSWFNELSGDNFLNLKNNRGVILHHANMIVDEFDNHDPETEEFECLCEIHSRLVERLLLLD